MSSTYLELTNLVLRRLNQVELTASNFASARGLHATAKDAVLDTVRKINAQKFEWPFNFVEASQVLTAGQNIYNFPADYKIADWDSFYIEKDPALNINTKMLSPISKNEWFRKFRDRDLDATGGVNIPDHIFDNGDLSFGITPAPDKAYTVVYRYYIKTVNLVNYDDVCTIPSEFDYVIIDGALYYMYMFLDNDQRAQTSENAFNRGLSYMTYLLIPKDVYAYTAVINDPQKWNTGYGPSY